MSMRLYVGNLLASTTSRDLRKLFAPYGTVTKAEIAIDKVHHTGRSLGFGFVEMADGGEAAIAALNGAAFQGRTTLTVEEAKRGSEKTTQDRFVEAARDFADVLALPGPFYDPEAAYKWYYIALSQQGYTTRFEDENHTPPKYCGPVGDFRNEPMVSCLVATLGFDKVLYLDAEATRCLAERNLTKG
jgi:hypothetical protein